MPLCILVWRPPLATDKKKSLIAARVLRDPHGSTGLASWMRRAALDVFRPGSVGVHGSRGHVCCVCSLFPFSEDLPPSI